MLRDLRTENLASKDKGLGVGMSFPQIYQAELARMRESLQQAMTTANPEEWQRLVTQILERIDRLCEERDYPLFEEALKISGAEHPQTVSGNGPPQRTVVNFVTVPCTQESQKATSRTGGLVGPKSDIANK